MSKIDQTLRNLAGSTAATNSPTSLTTKPQSFSLGDPNCPQCGGGGYLRQDLPLGHPDFGKLQICACREGEVRTEVRRRLFQMSNLDELRGLTFDTFHERGHIGLAPDHSNSLERAFNHAQQFAQSLQGWLLLQGGYGCGKTHLAAAIANFVAGLGVPTLFITVPDMLDTLRFSYGDAEADFETRFEQIRAAPLLILDDFGTQNATPWAQEKLFQILNYRYINHLPLVITTNLGLEEIEGRIRSRLQDPSLVSRVTISAPDYRNPANYTNAPEFSALATLSKYTFANFELRKSEGLKSEDQGKLEEAYRAALAFADKPQGWLVLLGGYATGKTHLAAAIGHYCEGNGMEVGFTTVPDLLDYLRAAFNPNAPVSLDRRFEQMRNMPLLILDDLGTQSATPWAREKLYQLFNHRYNAELPTVITSALSFPEIDPRLQSRIQDRRFCRNYVLDLPSFTGTTSSKGGRKPSSRSKTTR